MNIDYEKEYIYLLKENNITIMPKQNIIDNNETVAFWTWQNFTVPLKEYEDFNFTTWYDKANAVYEQNKALKTIYQQEFKERISRLQKREKTLELKEIELKEKETELEAKCEV